MVSAKQRKRRKEVCANHRARAEWIKKGSERTLEDRSAATHWKKRYEKYPMAPKEKQAIFVGTGASALRYKDQLQEASRRGHIIVTYGAALMFLLKELNIEPDYCIWIDPHSTRDAFPELLKKGNQIKTRLVIAHPMQDSSIETQKEYIGGSDATWLSEGGYTTYLDQLKELKEKMEYVEIETTTLKNINNFPTRPKNKIFVGKDLCRKDASHRFSHSIAVLGTTLRMGKLAPACDRKEEGLKYYFNPLENKLTGFALPLIHRLGFEEVYLIGWDGKGRRWNGGDKVSPRQMKTYANLLTWEEWEEYTGMRIYSLMNDAETIINQWCEHVFVEELFAGVRDKHIGGFLRMAKIKAREVKDTIVVRVSVPALPPIAAIAKEFRETVSRQCVEVYLRSEGVEVGKFLSGPHTVSNVAGPAKSGEFIFSKAPRKCLTPEPEPVIIEEKPKLKKKRKRVKRVSKTGNQTTS